MTITVKSTVNVSARLQYRPLADRFCASVLKGNPYKPHILCMCLRKSNSRPAEKEWKKTINTSSDS